MTFRHAHVVSLLAAIHLSAAVPTAQQPEPRTYASWLDAVTAHVPGERDKAVTDVAPWSGIELASVLSELRRQPTIDQRIIERALVLHTDIAILSRDNGGYNLAAARTGMAVVVDDGRAVGQMTGTAHWDFGRRLVNEVWGKNDRARLATRFYRTAGAVLQQWSEYPELTTHLAAGRRAVGDDAVLLMYEGTMRQAYAAPRMQRFFEERRRESAKRPTSMRSLPPMPGGPSPQIPELPPSFPSVRDSRSQAERLFRRALAIDPTLAEARIRLAHVLGDAGRHADAAAELKRLPAGQLPRFLAYYAAIITGRESRVRGQLDAARRAFEQAMTLYPHATAPKMALSELAIMRGDREAALAHLNGSEMPQASDEMTEPWWWIDRIHEPSAGTLVTELRQRVGQ